MISSNKYAKQITIMLSNALSNKLFKFEGAMKTIKKRQRIIK